MSSLFFSKNMALISKLLAVLLLLFSVVFALPQNKYDVQQDELDGENPQIEDQADDLPPLPIAPVDPTPTIISRSFIVHINKGDDDQTPKEQLLAQRDSLIEYVQNQCGGTVDKDNIWDGVLIGFAFHVDTEEAGQDCFAGLSAMADEGVFVEADQTIEPSPIETPYEIEDEDSEVPVKDEDEEGEGDEEEDD